MTQHSHQNENPLIVPEDFTGELYTRRAGRLGHVILHRPKALNALTPGMVRELGEVLTAWAADDAVDQVLISGAGERGLCAGGDVVNVRDAVQNGRGAEADAFFRHEYTVNALIADYPKPYIAFMDGVVLGGGVGVSAHGSHRVATERTRLGMPETGIGLLPDVGGSWLLSRLPSHFGLHLALTGEHLTGADAVGLGLADHYVPSDRLPALARSLETTHVDQAVGQVAEQAPAPPIWEHRPWIDAAYEQDTPEKVVAALQARDEEAAHQAAQTVLTKAPTSVKAAFAAVRRARLMRSVRQALALEFRVVHHLIRRPDFAEGIRAQLVDKDRNPQWSPARLEEVSDAELTGLFAEPAGGGLVLDGDRS